MSIDIDEMISETGGDRARSYLFEWILPAIPELNIPLIANTKYYVKASSFPESAVEELTTYWQGQQYKAGGSRRFGDWTVTVQSDSEGYLRFFCDVWMHEIHTVIPNITRYGKASGLTSFGYFRDQAFVLNDNEGDTSLGLYLHNSWPKNIGAMNLDYDSNDIATFDITFAYEYHVIVPTFGLF